MVNQRIKLTKTNMCPVVQGRQCSENKHQLHSLIKQIYMGKMYTFFFQNHIKETVGKNLILV